MTYEAEKEIGTVVNILPSGSAFVDLDSTGERVFVRSVITKRIDLEVGDTVDVTYVVNNMNRSGTCPWFALRVEHLNDMDGQDEDDVLDQELNRTQMRRALEAAINKGAELERKNKQKKMQDTRLSWCERAHMFLSVNGPATTGQIAKAVGNSVFNIRTHLVGMNNRGEIVRADIRTSGTQSKASATVWALELHDLLPEENEL